MDDLAGEVLPNVNVLGDGVPPLDAHRVVLVRLPDVDRRDELFPRSEILNQHTQRASPGSVDTASTGDLETLGGLNKLHQVMKCG